MPTTHPMNATPCVVPDSYRRIPLILSIDDDPEIPRTIEMRLRDYDVRVKRAFFGMQGFWEVIHEAPDLIVLDMAMPQGNGEFVLECVKNNRHSATIPVIVLSGTRDHGLCTRAFQLGAAQFLQKPVAFAELLHEIRRFVDLRERAPLQEHGGNLAVGGGSPTTSGNEETMRTIRCDIGPRGAP